MSISQSEPSHLEIKEYLDRRFGQESDLHYQIRVQSEQKGLPNIHIPIHVGKLLYLLAKIQAPQQILEIGTLGGYSTAWLAQGLASNGRLISLEMDPERAAFARKNLLAFSDKVIEVQVGHAVDLLAKLAENKEGPFDLIFIDADKQNTSLYLDWSLHLSRPGTLILIDNLIPKGEKIGYASNEEANAMYVFNDYLAQHPLLETASVATLVGQGRLDGFAIARVKDF